jgi:hypothetical protein
MSRETKAKDDIAVFVCTDADLAPWVLPHDPKAGRAATEAELPVLYAIMRGLHWLEAAGWRDPIYAPRDNTPIYMIEPRSTGVHEGYCDEQGRFWCYDGDVWPSRPIAWMPKEQPK